MDQNYEKLFAKIEPNEPDPALLGKIIGCIQKERIASARRRIFIFAASAICSLIAFIPALWMVRAGLAESGFAYFFSLLFSDFEIVAAYWQNFTLSLLETLPVMSLLVFSATLLAFLESLKLLTKNIRNIYKSKEPIKA